MERSRGGSVPFSVTPMEGSSSCPGDGGGGCLPGDICVTGQPGMLPEAGPWICFTLGVSTPPIACPAPRYC